MATHEEKKKAKTKEKIKEKSAACGWKNCPEKPVTKVAINIFVLDQSKPNAQPTKLDKEMAVDFCAYHGVLAPVCCSLLSTKEEMEKNGQARLHAPYDVVQLVEAVIGAQSIYGGAK